jgi:hypothetical protein
MHHQNIINEEHKVAARGGTPLRPTASEIFPDLQP